MLESNIAAFGLEKQNVLSKLHIAINGVDLAAEYFLINIAGLGIQKISIFEEKTKQAKSFLSAFGKTKIDGFQQLYPNIEISHLESKPIKELIDNTDYFIEFTPNDLWESDISYDKNRITTTLGTQVTSPLESAIIGSQLANKIRKDQFLFDYEIAQNIKWDLPNTSLPPKSSLIIGAGGIGTYTALQLALNDVSQIHIMDYDTVEAKNLNRQALYGQSIGKSKALALKESLQKINPTANIESFHRKLDAHTVKQLALTRKYDCIYSCPDNAHARVYASKLAILMQVPLVDGGCAIKSGQVTTYIPGKTLATHKQFGFDKSIPKQRVQSCADVNPSVVTPNCMIGSLLPYFSHSTCKVRYDSSYESILSEDHL